MTITPELKQAVEETGSARLEDENGEAYLITKYRNGVGKVLTPRVPNISEGIRLSQEAFARDLPELLKNKRNLNKWVAYSRDKCVLIHKDYLKVIREVNRLVIPEEEFITDVIEPNALEPLEMDYPSSWL